MKSKNKTLASASKFVSGFLVSLGEDIKRPGLRGTPNRVAKMYNELLRGYNKDPKTIFKTFSSEGYHDLVTVSHIDFYSLCEHHLVPFFGKIHIGYIPNGRIFGFSKFARLVEIYSRRLQTQENLTNQIANALDTNLHPQGLIVHVEAEHLCVSMRGVNKKGVITKTTIRKGTLEKNSGLADQFYKDIFHKKDTVS